jgi:hypothetical protein
MKGAVAMASDEDNWRAESDLSTLLEAEKIRKDKKRLDAALKIAKQKSADLKSVAGEAALAEKPVNPFA